MWFQWKLNFEDTYIAHRFRSAALHRIRLRTCSVVPILTQIPMADRKIGLSNGRCFVRQQLLANSLSLPLSVILTLCFYLSPSLTHLLTHSIALSTFSSFSFSVIKDFCKYFDKDYVYIIVIYIHVNYMNIISPILVKYWSNIVQYWSNTDQTLVKHWSNTWVARRLPSASRPGH